MALLVIYESMPQGVLPPYNGVDGYSCNIFECENCSLGRRSAPQNRLPQLRFQCAKSRRQQCLFPAVPKPAHPSIR